jgi:UDP-N-acetylmuramyl pentapeptide phosphotransferase/UDP-N-acetylglucosamine-1-phosphate transferase
MKQRNMKTYVKILVFSMLLFVATAWTCTIQMEWLAPLVEALAFMGFTWYWCTIYKTEKTSLPMILLAIVVGRLILVLWPRTFNFCDSLGSLHTDIASLIGIALGYVCYRWNKFPIWVICFAVIIFMAALADTYWHDCVIALSSCYAS